MIYCDDLFSSRYIADLFLMFFKNTNITATATASTTAGVASSLTTATAAVASSLTATTTSATAAVASSLTATTSATAAVASSLTAITKDQLQLLLQQQQLQQ